MKSAPQAVLGRSVSSLGGSSPAAAARQVFASDEPWRNPNQPPLQRSNELLAVLSAEQKIAIALGDFSTVASFGVPALTCDDGPNGIRTSGTTAMPSSQALASTFDHGLGTSSTELDHRATFNVGS